MIRSLNDLLWMEGYHFFPSCTITGDCLIKCYRDNSCVWQRALFSMNFVKVQNECMLVIEGT